MKGHIRPRGKGAWAIVLDLGRDEQGKRKQKWVTVHGTKKDAERELTRLLHEMNTGTFVEPSKTTLAEYLEHWLAAYAKTNVAPKTFERYVRIVRSDLAPTLGHHPLAKLQPLHIQAYYSEALQHGRKDGKGGLAPRTVLQHHRVLREALQQAVKWQLLARNPADSVEPPRPARYDMMVLDDDGVRMLLAAAEGTSLYVAVYVAVNTGLRRGELLGLKWEDVDIGGGVAHVRRVLQKLESGDYVFREPKTPKSRRSVALAPSVVEVLKKHRARQAEEKLLMGAWYRDLGLVIAQPDGSPIDPSTLSRQFHRLTVKAGLPPIRFHDLRHTHATLMLKAGIHPKIVSERLGHAGVGITLDTYSHVLPGLQEEAARKLDEQLFGTASSRPDRAN